MTANANGGDDEIILPAGRLEIEISPNIINEPETGDFDITSDTLTVTGQGHWETVIDGNYLDRIFDVADATLVLGDLVLSRGEAGEEDGGGVCILCWMKT